MLLSDLDSVKKTLKRYDFPVDVIVETTAFCNLKCIMCPQPFLKRERGEMNFDIFKKIVDEVATKSPSTRLWVAIMGEPLIMGKRLISMIRYAKDKGIKSVNLNTNALLLTPELSESLIAAGLDYILVGIDAQSENTYKRIRIGGDFHSVISNVEYLLEARKSVNTLLPEVITQFIVMDENANEVEGFKSYWLERGAVVKIRPKLGWGTGVKADNLNLPDSERSYPCPWLTRTVSIHWSGRFAQCDGDYEGEYSPGDIKSQTIEEVWRGELAIRREKHWNNDFSHPLCVKCKDWQVTRARFFYPSGHSLYVT